MTSSDDSDGDFVPGQAEEEEENASEEGALRPTGGGDGGGSSDEGGGGGDPMNDDDDADNDYDGGGGSDEASDGDGGAEDGDEEGSIPAPKRKKKPSLKKKHKGKDKDKKRRKRKKRSSSGSSRSAQAEEGEEEEEEEEEDGDGGSGGGGGSDDDDEDDEDNEYRLDGFVVGDEEDDGDVSDGGNSKRRRNKSSGGDNKRKRLRKARDEHGIEAADDEDLELIREAQGVSTSQSRGSDRNELVAEDGQDLRKQLFDGEEEEVARREQQRQQQRRRQQQDEFDSEDDGDFIVDDLGTERRQGRRQQQESFQAGFGASGPSQDQVFEAMEIFGEGIQDFDFNAADDEEVGADGKLRPSKDARRQALAGIEPSVLKEKFLTEQDKLIQETDRPERLQLRMPNRGEASDAERQDEAMWICNQLDLGYAADEKMAQAAVEHVLRFLGVESQEIPFVWHYRKDYLWTSQQTYLTLDHLWKIYELDETWDKVGNRRDKVAKASKALWKLMDGDEDSDEGDEEGYSSETPDERDERLAKEETAKETRDERVRRSQQAIENFEKALTKAEEEAAQGAEKVNNDRIAEAQRTKKGAAGGTGAEGEEAEIEIGEGDWERATEESLAKALEEAKEAVNHARSYLIGLKGELAVEENEEQEQNLAREARRKERRDVAAAERQLRRDEARSAMEEEASLFPSDQYSDMINSQEEVELKDLQDYVALVSLTGEADEKAKVRNASASGHDKRRPRKAGRADDNLYRAARQAGLRGLANKFSITAAQLGEVIMGFTQQFYPVPTPAESVELVASDMKGAEDTPLFSSAESILKGVRHILAREIAAEPRVKAKCRSTYRRFALVSTAPTAKGKQEIDAFHPLYGLHYLERKAMQDFLTGTGHERSQWLQIEKGKAEGLLTYEIHPPQNRVESYGDNGETEITFELDEKAFLDLLAPTYNPSVGVSAPVKQGWDEQRNLVLHEALVEHLLPALETEVVFDLKAASRAAVVEEASRAMERRLSVGPYEREDLNVLQKIIKADSGQKYDQTRVVGIYVSNDPREDSWAAAIDPTGSVLDHLQIPRQRDAKAKKLKAFIKSNRPHVVCVSTSAGYMSRSMLDMLVDRRSGQNGEPKTGVLADAQKEYKREKEDVFDEEDEEEVTDKWTNCALAPVKDDVASIFARSTRGEKEFPDFSVNQRAAVALARYLQDPLVEFAGMWTTMDSSGNFGHEAFSLRLHPLQDMVPPQQLLKVWTHRLMDAVSAVGVDVNHAAEHEHAMGVLQFVPGLGPRKAAKLRERLGTVLGGIVPSRKALLSSQLLKSLVYTNAAGFLRIRERGKLAEQLEGQLDPFDDTRVHPECYNTQDWAQRICANALDVQVDDDYFPIVESAMDDSREALTRLCQQDPTVDARMPPNNLNDSVNQLDLRAYADELQRQGEGKRAQQLDSIVEEIRYPYRDRRMPYTPPDDDELFEWLTGETDATLREGVLVPVRVFRHNDAGVRVRLEGGPGLFGFVKKDYVTDDVLPTDPITGQTADLKAVVKENQLMEAAILRVDKARFELSLSLRKSDTMPNPEKWDAPHGQNINRGFGVSGWNRPESLPPLDPKFNFEKAKKEAIERIKKANSHRAGRKREGVRYPRSIMHPQFKNLTHLEAEEFLKEASGSRGEALIRPSSKGSDHLSLTWMWIEGEFMHTDIKELGKQPGSMLAPRLQIGSEEYEDLDEILSRRVSACNDLINDLLASDKYNPATTAEVEELLKTQKAETPGRIPYLMCRRGVPGYLNLLYIPNSSVRKLTVEISPEGFVISKRSFKTLPELIRWFKKNAQSLGKSASSSARKSTRKSTSNSSSGGTQHYNQQQQQPPLPPENPGNVPPPPPPRPAGQQQQQPQQYPAYNGGAYGYNQPQQVYGAASQAGYAPPPGGAVVPAPPVYQQQQQQQYGQPQQQQWYDPQQQQQQVLYQQQFPALPSAPANGNQYQHKQQYAQQAGGARDSSQARK
eukprot:g16106.t1